MIAREHGIKIIFDSNYRASLWPDPDQARTLHRQIISLVDMALLTFEDEALLYNDKTPQHTLQRYTHLPELVIKLGAHGCLVRHNTQAAQSIPAMSTQSVIDTTAAGDAFNAAYIAARLASISTTKAAQMAHQLCHLVIQHQGAILPIVAMQSLQRVFQEQWTV